MATLHTELRTHFEDCYEASNGMKYYWKVKDASALKQIIAQFKFLIEQKKGFVFDSDYEVKHSFIIICKSIQTLPELSWYKSNFSIPIINSKLNDIISAIKQGKSGKHQNLITELRNSYTGIKQQEQPKNWRNRS